MNKKNVSFEQALERLEEIADQLELGDVALEDTMALFQEANELNQFCLQKLGKAEERLRVLSKEEDGFQLTLEESE